MKNALKFMSTFALSGILLITTTVMGYAAETVQSDKNLQMRDETYWEEVKDLKVEAENYVNSVTSLERVGGHKSLTIPTKKQINSYYCGPASVRMVLLYHGIDQTQSYIAGKIGTTEAGSDVAPMRTYLNNQVGSGTYTYVNVTELAFADGVVYSIGKSKPLICMIQTSKLKYYNGHKSVHFVVAKGYDWDMNGSASYSTVTLNDPNNNNDYYGERTCTWTEMTQALNASNGWYILAK
ncbi:C39 family peptidase [Anaerovoracaceae bacterium 41-7]